jgi:short subunit dehydrogenase-like uncharacterized protein
MNSRAFQLLHISRRELRKICQPPPPPSNAETVGKPSALYGTYCWSQIYTLIATRRENRSNRITYFFPMNRYNVRIFWWIVIMTVLNMKQTSKTRIEFHQMQQDFFNNKIEPLHVSENDGPQEEATNTSKKMLRMCCPIRVSRMCFVKKKKICIC